MTTTQASESPAQLAGRRGSRETQPHDHQEVRPMTTGYDTPATALARALASPSIDVAITEIPALQCEYCADVDAVTTVRVTGYPRRDVFEPVELVDVCGLCAPEVIERAIEEHDSRSRRLPLVEVAA